jgi:hypothetical protein
LPGSFCVEVPIIVPPSLPKAKPNQAIPCAIHWCDFEDPELNANLASPAWANSANDEILPVVTGESPLNALRSYVDLERLRCRLSLVELDEEVTYAIFSDEGRQLQLEVHRRPQAGRDILTPAISPPSVADRRTQALRRLADLADTGELRDHLYPADTRAPRLARVLQALDGAMTGARHRDIATSLFGERRVSEDWGLPDNHLRDHVRRAIAHGRKLIGGGFSRLLA